MKFVTGGFGRFRTHHNDAMIDQVVCLAVICLHEVHSKELGHLLDLLQGASQADHARVELVHVLLDQLA